MKITNAHTVRFYGRHGYGDTDMLNQTNKYEYRHTLHTQ